MRIATSTTYEQQTTAIDNLSAQYQTVGQQLSTGISLNAPSDDPSVISQDLTLNGTIAAENGDASNANAAQNQLTFTDTTLNSLTSVLQTARNLVVEGATDIIPNGTQRPLIGKQVEGLISQAIQLANAQYGNTYIFAGTGARTSPPVTAVGDPPSGITFTGNLNSQTEEINGQQVQTGTTLQQGFNYNSTDGTPNAIQLLINIRNLLENEPAVSESSGPINVTGQIIYGGANNPAPTTLGIPNQTPAPPAVPTVADSTTGPITNVPLTADNSSTAGTGPSYYSIAINGTNPTTGQPSSAQFTFSNTTQVCDGPPATAASVVGQINAQTATTGVAASWNEQTQRLTLTSTAPNSPDFSVADVATPANALGPGLPPVAATNTANFVEAFQLNPTGSVVAQLSTTLGDVDAVTNAVMAGRAQVGQQIQNLAATTNQLQSLSTDNTKTKSGYEDTNIASATSQFSLVQTALQAAYATTTRLESKSLLDYLPA